MCFKRQQYLKEPNSCLPGDLAFSIAHLSTHCKLNNIILDKIRLKSKYESAFTQVT